LPPAEKIDAYLAKDKSLQIYRQPLTDILRAAPTLSKSSEQIVAQFGAATGTAAATYSTLSNADMPWPKIKLADGQEVTIDQAAYTKYRCWQSR
jgi:oligoendopeptidase F